MISSLDVEGFTFEEIMKEQKKYVKHVVDHILRLNPDIIFVEKGGHMQIIEALTAKNIVIVNKIKDQVLKKIQKATGARFIRSTKKIENIDGR